MLLAEKRTPAARLPGPLPSQGSQEASRTQPHDAGRSGLWLEVCTPSWDPGKGDRADPQELRREADLAPPGLPSIRLGPAAWTGECGRLTLTVALQNQFPGGQGQGWWAAQGSWLNGSDCQPQALPAGLSIHLPTAPTPGAGVHEASHTCRCWRRKPRGSWGQTAAWRPCFCLTDESPAGFPCVARATPGGCRGAFQVRLSNVRGTPQPDPTPLGEVQLTC